VEGVGKGVWGGVACPFARRGKVSRALREKEVRSMTLAGSLRLTGSVVCWAWSI
jgi:hypothetical protein